MTAIPTAIRKAVLLRADGQCERCGAWSALELHHRLYRSRGGAHMISNLVAICGFGNTAGKNMCHGWAHDRSDDAERDGWSIASGGDPDLIPVHVGESWFFLTTKKVRCTSAEAERAFAGFTLIKGMTT